MAEKRNVPSMEATFSQCPASEASAWMLLTSTSISYTVHDAKPLVLESDDMFKLHGSDALNKKYLSPILPLTIKMAKEALHQEESAQIVGGSSGVIRYDTMQLPSNPIPEDKYISTLGQETNEIKWMLFRIYDGHAYGLEISNFGLELTHAVDGKQ